jgi:hypothetical protein
LALQRPKMDAGFRRFDKPTIRLKATDFNQSDIN